MAGIVDQIKERLDIVDLISSYLKLQKSGINYKARCPFHNEKTGSFFVSPERQIWHCFGCGVGGDAFGFIKQIEGMEFPEALRVLAARVGVKLERQSPEYQEYQNAKTKLYEISELAARFFEKQLHQSEVGKTALAYLQDRGLTDESIKDFRLGYAPDSWTALYDFLDRNYDGKEVLNTGLIIKKDSPSYAKASEGEGRYYYDRFRSRIIFPIFDINKQVVGFTGRVFGDLAKQDDAAKYVNTPQTAIYDKGRLLYGLDKAKLEIRRNNRCLVVEGNMDVIMSHQAGAKHVVASSGTALTDGHLKIIKRYTDNLDLCFDADSAGVMATDRGVDLALARGFNVGIISINELNLKDPADYVKIHGARWAEYTAKSKPFMEFYFDFASKSYDITTALGKKLFGQKLMPFLASMANKIEQAHWISEMALAIKTKEEILYQELALTKPRATPSESEYLTEQAEIRQNPSDAQSTNLDPQEEILLSLIIKKPDLANEIKPESEKFLSDKFRELAQKIKPEQISPIIGQLVSAPMQAGNEQGEFASLTKVRTEGLYLDFARLRSQELWNDYPDHELNEEFNKLISQIKKRQVSAKLANLEYDIKSAEKEQDKKRLSALLEEFSKTSKQLGQ